MSAATEQNNGDVAVEKVAVDAAAAVKEDLKKPAVDEKVVAADNGTASKEDADEEDAPDSVKVAVAPVKEQVKGTKRPAEVSTIHIKKKNT
ncbi:bacchus-like [Rhagoletis pomonella]|uniref:bacchus-like n=1 Tax=Rhagoletis pomonella TaxID=28610 RepID=UPI001782EF5B|nr:bacchus-like [Rhagoletis pomonella]